jgi:hypothetical protein
MTTSPLRWSKHFHHYWEERSGDPGLPTWFRIMALAYGMHRPNGHAQFRKGSKYSPGDLALILRQVDHRTGEIIPARAELVRDHIDYAVAHDLLAPGSHSGCLIVPAHGVVNDYGPTLRCPVDHVAARRKHQRQVQRDARQAAA